MLNFLYEIVITICLMFVWLSLGVAFVGGRGDFSFSKSLIFGFMLYYAIFQIYYLPVLFSFVSLRVVSYVWLIIIGTLVVFCIWLRRAVWAKMYTRTLSLFKGMPLLGWTAAIAVTAFIITSLYFEVTDADDIYYTGTIATSVYTDSMFCYDSETGELLNALSNRYALPGYVMQSAVLCVLFSIHPLLLTRFVLPAAVLIVVFLIYYRIGFYLFKYDRNKAFLFVIIVATLHIYGSYNIYVPSRFLIFRTEQGKALLANVSIPLMLLLFVKSAYCDGGQKFSGNVKTETIDHRSVNYWMQVFVGVTASVSFSLSAAFVVPASLCAYYLPYAFAAKRPRILLGLALCLVPPIIIYILYAYGGDLYIIPAERFTNAV